MSDSTTRDSAAYRRPIYNDQDRDTITDIAFNRNMSRHVREIARGMLRADDKYREDRRNAQALWDQGWRPTGE